MQINGAIEAGRYRGFDRIKLKEHIYEKDI